MLFATYGFNTSKEKGLTRSIIFRFKCACIRISLNFLTVPIIRKQFLHSPSTFMPSLFANLKIVIDVSVNVHELIRAFAALRIPLRFLMSYDMKFKRGVPRKSWRLAACPLLFALEIISKSNELSTKWVAIGTLSKMESRYQMAANFQLIAIKTDHKCFDTSTWISTERGVEIYSQSSKLNS